MSDERDTTPKCALVIPGTWICCGEGGQFCSWACYAAAVPPGGIIDGWDLGDGIVRASSPSGEVR